MRNDLPALVTILRKKAVEIHSTASGQDLDLAPAMAAMLAASAAIRCGDRLIRHIRRLVNDRRRCRRVHHDAGDHHLVTHGNVRTGARRVSVALLLPVTSFRDGRHDTEGDCAENEREEQ
jgi:hypothetical protein